MGLGDEIMALGIVEEIYETRGVPVVIRDRHRNPRHHRAWENSPVIEKNPRKDSFTIINEPGIRPYFKAYIPSRLTLFDPNHIARAGRICLTEQEKTKAMELMPKSDFVIVEPLVRSPGSKNKNWGIKNWEEVIEDFPLPVYQFSLTTNDLIIKGAIPIFSPDFRISAGIVEKAKLVLTVDGGMHHIAASMKRPAVVVFGGFCDPKITGYSFHSNFYADIKGSPCGQYNECPHCKKAMALIKPEEVRKEALRIINKNTITLDELKEYLKGKKIAVIGNSPIVLEKEHPEIDGCDLIIRFNKGNPRGKEKYIGSRTDILSSCIPISTEMKQLNPKYIIWLDIEGRNPLIPIDEIVFIYPYEAEVKRIIGMPPSSGCMIVDLLIRKCDCKPENLFLYGFDFFKTGSWHRDPYAKYKSPHVGDIEQQYIQKLFMGGVGSV